MVSNKWKYSETISLEKDWANMTSNELAIKYNRPYSSVSKKAKRMGLPMTYQGEKKNVLWTLNELMSIVTDYPEMNEKALEAKYGRSFKAIHMRAIRLGLKRDRTQSYTVKIEDMDGNLVYNKTIERGENSKATLKSIIPKLRAMNKRAIDRGEWTLAITHGLECFQN